MEQITYRAFVVEETEGKYFSSIKKQNIDQLPAGDLLIRVHYSSLNYKDALSASGNKGVTRKYPHTPGIDAAGVVVSSGNKAFNPGDKVIVTGYDLGMNTSGGFGEYIRVPAEWAVMLPENLTLKEAMIMGTAGFTAGISVTRLTELVKPSQGKIIVTGATGGVGSVALSILSKLSYSTVAVSGKLAEYDYLKNLGADEIISRNDFLDMEKKPVLSAKYAGGIDTVGGPYLENILKTLSPLGAVTTCGSVASTDLNMTVFPFILRGISLIGVSAQNYPMHLREFLWNRLAADWKPENLMQIYNEINLDQLAEAIRSILKGQLKGRTIVNMEDSIV
ncbi:MAG TPA: YhdH/YhfP family quinone oxidoreductase [Paludibacteraceae bacterium]|nr:YhdH/YhfP family quinone oxidoreductase [Paludibacteraceae bacterium]HPT43722.1 YhdH/YhfP family quinone oxidoreductase [Paludibacteraceae bacterium]